MFAFDEDQFLQDMAQDFGVSLDQIRVWWQATEALATSDRILALRDAWLATPEGRERYDTRFQHIGDAMRKYGVDVVRQLTIHRDLDVLGHADEEAMIFERYGVRPLDDGAGVKG